MIEHLFFWLFFLVYVLGMVQAWVLNDYMAEEMGEELHPYAAFVLTFLWPVTAAKSVLYILLNKHPEDLERD